MRSCVDVWDVRSSFYALFYSEWAGELLRPMQGCEDAMRGDEV